MGNVTYSAPETESKHFADFYSKLPSMAGKVVVITGCTTGTGNVCAKACAQLGAKVVMLNRASERADSALESIRTAVPGADVSLVACDLMSFASVRECVTELNRLLSGRGVDVLCNNAGIMATVDKATEDGCDTQMQTNHLSHFLLTAGLWPLLEQAAAARGEARIVNHSSGARTGGKLKAEFLGKNGGNLGGDDAGCIPTTGPRWKRYQQSKLANVVFTYALDDKLKAASSKIKCLVAHPGGAVTSLQSTTVNDGGMGGCFTNLLMGQCQSGEDGTMPLLTCCCVVGVKSREFYGPKNGIIGPALLMKADNIDDVSKQMLWKESLVITGAQYNF